MAGRKNLLFAGSEGGASAAAVPFSLVHCCMNAGNDPFDYLRDVLHRLPDATPARLRQLTPKVRAARATVGEEYSVVAVSKYGVAERIPACA